MNKSVLSQITSYLEDNDRKPVNFNGRAIRFTCLLLSIIKTVEPLQI